jgi:hypothetical protein
VRITDITISILKGRTDIHWRPSMQRPKPDRTFRVPTCDADVVRSRLDRGQAESTSDVVASAHCGWHALEDSLRFSRLRCELGVNRNGVCLTHLASKARREFLATCDSAGPD